MTQEDIVILSQLLDQKFEPVYTRLDLLESDVRELKSGMSEIKQRVASVEQKVTERNERSPSPSINCHCQTVQSDLLC